MIKSDPNTGERPVPVWAKHGRNNRVPEVLSLNAELEQELRNGAVIKVGDSIYKIRKGVNKYYDYL